MNFNTDFGLGDFLATNFGWILIIFGAAIVIFLIIRALVLWYWKIDQIVYFLKNIESNTRELFIDRKEIKSRENFIAEKEQNLKEEKKQSWWNKSLFEKKK